MSEYRKTATIKAVQWFKMGDHPAVILKSDPNRYADEGVPWCPTLEGGHIVTPGDWIATGVQGEHWPIKADVFAATYAPVDAARAEGVAPVKKTMTQNLTPEEMAQLEQLVADAPYERLKHLGITREWFERKAALEGDLDVGAGHEMLPMPAPVSAPLEREGVAWAWLAANIGMELSWGDADDAEEGEPCVWRVHRCSGGRNDREWDLIATGATPLEAVTQALALSQQDQVGLTTPAVLGEPSGDALRSGKEG